MRISDWSSDVCSSDLDGIGPPVECRFGLGKWRYAIEHTLIEPFANHIRTGAEFEELVRPVEAALDGTMPRPGTYRSEERRVGKECVSPCRSRRSTYH